MRMMKAGKLIEKLSKLDPEADVFVTVRCDILPDGNEDGTYTADGYVCGVEIFHGRNGAWADIKGIAE